MLEFYTSHKFILLHINNKKNTIYKNTIYIKLALLLTIN